MKVTLISHTPNALNLLLFTKNTRLKMEACGMEELDTWSEAKKLEELAYMRDTIASSWEFVDYTFMLEDVSRAFTHQLVRHRVGTAFAQQTMRTLDVSDFGYTTGPTLMQPSMLSEDEDFQTESMRAEMYTNTMSVVNSAYKSMLNLGAKQEDARGVLPTNIKTNIVFKANLRTLSDMALKRLCVKTQGEFQEVFRAIRAEVLRVHPWADGFIEVHCAKWGTCMFPRHEGCPVKPIVFNPESGKAFNGGNPATKYDIRTVWAQIDEPDDFPF